MDNEEAFAPTPYAARNNSFDPFTQPFIILLQDGIQKIDTSIDDIDVLLRLSVYQAICQAAQLGAAAVLMVAIFLMTSNEKRRSSVFILNAISLLLIVLRGIFQLATIQGPFYEWFRWKTQQYFDMGNARAVSACSEVMSVLLTIAILSSLYVQVKIVCCNLSDARRYIINISNVLVIATAVVMRFALSIMNIKYNIMMTDGNYNEFQMYGSFASAANITLVLAIAFSTVIFTGKLAFAIKARRSMGIKQFGPMQIIFVMGCQTMFTPLVFTIVTYTGIENANVQSFVPTIVAISLPLSGMWAAVNAENVHIASPDRRRHRVVPIGASGGTYSGNSTVKGASTNTSGYYDDDKYGLTTTSPQKSARVDSGGDLEMQKIRDGVNVERTYSVRSD